RRHTPRRWETPERHRGGRTDYRRGAANLPISTPPRGTGTSPRSSPSATLIPSPSILEIAIPGHQNEEKDIDDETIYRWRMTVAMICRNDTCGFIHTDTLRYKNFHINCGWNCVASILRFNIGNVHYEAEKLLLSTI
ncbi:unnamed protein product, partial [Musa acuminata subsp. burmannicoides]